jgi:hypothetical protein
VGSLHVGFRVPQRLHTDHEEPSATPESGNAHLELDDIRDAHATTPSILCFYFICATILHSLSRPVLDGQAVVLGRLSLVSPVLFRLNPILYTLNNMRLNDILMSLPWNVPYRYRLLEISLPEKSFDKTELKATSVTSA